MMLTLPQLRDYTGTKVVLCQRCCNLLEPFGIKYLISYKHIKVNQVIKEISRERRYLFCCLELLSVFRIHLFFANFFLVCADLSL